MTLEKLKKNSDFKKVYEKGHSVADRYLVLYVLKNDLNINRIGFSISKKVGKAVRRNKVRRLLSEIYRLVLPSMKVGWDIIVIVRPRFIDETGYRVLYNSFIKLVKKSGLNIEEELNK